MPNVRRQTTKKSTRKKAGILSKIKPLSFETDEGIQVLLYGRSGTGKTTLWGTFPAPILSIICSGSKRPGELRSLDTPENRKRIQTLVVQETSEITEILEELPDQDYKTVVLDHASGLQDFHLKEILGLDELPAQKSWGLATQQQYGQCTQKTKEQLRALLSLPCNVVIIAQERSFNDDKESELIDPTVGAGLTPSLAGWLNSSCDYICQTLIRSKFVEKKVAGKSVKRKTKEVEYCLRTAPHEVYTTKFRVPRGRKLPELIVDPTYGKIMKVIRGEEV